MELDLALDTDVPVDAAHAVVSDLADRAFGAGWQRWYTEALDAEGLGDDAGRLLRQDDVAGNCQAVAVANSASQRAL